jgi:hypothetical protein
MSALDGGELLALRSGSFNSRIEDPGIHWYEAGWAPESEEIKM